MAKLTQSELKAHDKAQALLDSDKVLTSDQIADVLEGWHEGATHSSARQSAFFTPFELAMNFALEIPSGGKILDLCAGIGMLSAAAQIYHQMNPGTLEFTLVEINPDYCAVAQRLLPNAEIICGSIFDPAVQKKLTGRRFDMAIANPPYGTKNVANGAAPRYHGSICEYAVIDLASDYADAGVFIIPQNSVPFRLSGFNSLREGKAMETAKYQRFAEQTKIDLKPGIGIDTSFAEALWRGTSIKTEIATADFREARAQRAASSNSRQIGFSLAA